MIGSIRLDIEGSEKVLEHALEEPKSYIEVSPY